MHNSQHLMNLINQILAVLLTILLAIWQELRNARKAKGFTIEEAAELIEVAPITYSRWERGEQRPHPRHHQYLATMLLDKDLVAHQKEHKRMGDIFNTLSEKDLQRLTSATVEQEFIFNPGERSEIRVRKWYRIEKL